MNRPIAVFTDSDVIISSLISSSGAANLLLNNSQVKNIISDFSVKEQKIVAGRLNISSEVYKDLIRERIKIVPLKIKPADIRKKFGHYVNDPDDAHIVAGAVNAKVKFLITYNLKHFKKESIKKDFDILVVKPALFLQYLRSQ